MWTLFSFLFYMIFIQVKPQAIPLTLSSQAFFILRKEISHAELSTDQNSRITLPQNYQNYWLKWRSSFLLSYVLELQISPTEKRDAFLAILCPEIEKLRWSASKSCFLLLLLLLKVMWWLLQFLFQILQQQMRHKELRGGLPKWILFFFFPSENCIFGSFWFKKKFYLRELHKHLHRHMNTVLLWLAGGQ